MKKYTRKDIDNLDRLSRANLINSISGFKSANLVGTRSAQGISNLAIVSSVIHVGSNPPLIGFMMRPPVVRRDTYDNISHSGFYTINHLAAKDIRNGHLTSGKFPKDVSEFAPCDFNEEYIDGFSAPFVQESRIKMGLTLIEEIPIRSNNCIFLIGEVHLLILSEDYSKPDGSLDLNLAETACISGLNSYHQPQHLADLPYVSRQSLENLK